MNMETSKPQFINEILSKQEKRQFLQELENAYIELANDPEYQAEVALWEVTVGDGGLGNTVALNQ
jgi:uncharacterized cupin superfamily protein